MGEITTMPKFGTETAQIGVETPETTIDPQVVQIHKRSPTGVGKRLTQKNIVDMVVDFVGGSNISQLARLYGISRARAAKIIEQHKDLVDKAKSELRARSIEQIGQIVDEKRYEVVTSIDGKSIKRASLKGKTSALYDLTQVSRLEKGLSTVNQNIVVADLSAEQLKQFIRTGSVDNSGEVQGEVVDAQPSNGQVNGIDGIEGK